MTPSISSGQHWNGLRITVDGNFDAITKDLNELQRVVVPDAAAAALNKAAAQARTGAVREIASIKDVPQKQIRERFTIRKAHRGQQLASMAVQLRLRVTAMFAHFVGRPRQQKTGSKVRSHFFLGGFVKDYRGSPTIYKRAGKERYPIRFQSVPLEPEASSIALKHVTDIVARKWDAIFNHELWFRLMKKGLL